MGFLDIFRKNKEMEFMFDLDLMEDKSKKAYMKKLAIDICVNFLGRTISQSEFRVKNNNDIVKDELYYRLNIRPNKNQNASMFWQTVIYKLIYDNEVLVIQARDGDLLIADDFTKKEFAVYEDIFTNVIVKNLEFNRSYSMDDVFYLEYNNQRLAPLLNELFADYGDLIGSIFRGQKRKNQIRSTVKIDKTGSLTEKDTAQLQSFINKIYEAIDKKDVAVVPEQKGFDYKEHSQQRAGGGGQSVDEVNKATNGYLDQVAMALGIPLGILHGDMADVEKQTKTYMTFTVNSITQKIQDEANGTFFDMEEHLEGQQIEVRKIPTKDVFEIATAVDKNVSSGAFTPNEMRDAAGWDRKDDEKLDRHYITKNYAGLDEAESVEGGED